MKVNYEEFELKQAIKADKSYVDGIVDIALHN
jgi:hypothetical protein